MRNILFVNFFVFLIGMLIAPTLTALPFPEGMANWSEQEKNAQRKAGSELLVRLNKAIANKDKVFVIPRGNYRFDKVTDDPRPTHVKISDARDMTIEGNGSNFFFETFYNGLLVNKSVNLKIKNIVMDWDPVPFTQGKVVSVDHKKNTFVFKPDKGYEKLYDKLFKSDRLRGILFNPATRQLKAGQRGFCLKILKKLHNDSYEVLVRGFHELKAAECGFKAGDLIAILARMHRAVKTAGCSNVVYENVILHASPFVCFVEHGGKGGIVYRQCGIVKRPGTDRLISGNADGFNSSKALKGPTLDGCKIENIGDDFVNIHGVYYRIFKQLSPRRLIVQPFEKNGVAKPVVAFIENETWNSLGKRTVISQKQVKYLIPESKGNARKWAAAKNFKPGSKIKAFELELDQPVEIKSAAFFSVSSTTGNNAVIKNCNFTGSLARGIRLQSEDTVIENNIVKRCLGPGLTTGGQPGFWGEAVTSKNLKVYNNSFVECAIGGGNKLPAAVMFNAPGTIGKAEAATNIVFSGNKIIRPGYSAMLLKVCENVEVKNNTFSEIGLVPAYDGNKKIPPILIQGAENIKFANNSFDDIGIYVSKNIIERE